MKRIAVFPGQGSQQIGMGKSFYDNFASAREVFEEVNDAINFNLTKVIFEGPIEDLTSTINTQPALMAVSVGIIKVLERDFELPLEKFASFVAGHSLGEYSALCTAKSLSLTDTARLLRIRGAAMQEAVPAGLGTMAALLGMENDEVEELVKKANTKGICDIANDNSPGQIVISGEILAIEEAIKIAAELGKKAVKLPVSAPFHSRMMEKAAAKMKDALEDVQINTPIMPLIANVTAMLCEDPEEIRKNLVTQVAGKVMWRQSMENTFEMGVTHLVEIGSGKVLAGLAKRINKDIQSFNISSTSDIEEFVKTL